jgi:hypothetical protein
MLKPGLGTEVQWGHPMSSGLMNCFLFNEYNGMRVFDIGRSRAFNAEDIDQVNIHWRVEEHGVGLEQDGPVTGLLELLADQPELRNSHGGGFTIQMTGFWWALPSAYVNSKIILNARTTPKHSWHWNGAEWNDKFYIFVQTGVSTSVNNNTGWDIVVRDLRHFTMTYDGTTLRFYVDGHEQFSTVTAFYDDSNPLKLNFGHSGGFFGAYFAYHVFSWNRALAPEEIAFHVRDPYCMFRPPSRSGYGNLPYPVYPVLEGDIKTNSKYTGKLQLLSSG